MQLLAALFKIRNVLIIKPVGILLLFRFICEVDHSQYMFNVLSDIYGQVQ